MLRAFYTVIDTSLTAKKATLNLDRRLVDVENDRQKALRFPPRN